MRRPPVPDATWAYFLDVDGTLVAIAGTPEEVRISRDLQALIGSLRRSTGGAVALISGRSIADIDRLFPGTALPVAGQHGIERRDATGRITRVGTLRPDLDILRAALTTATEQHPGLVLEDKGMSMALHYRMAPRLGGYAHRLARSLLPHLGGGWRVQPGKCVVEVRPAGVDKGTAIHEFMKEEPFVGRSPVFMGDDATDEYGFVVVRMFSGVAVKVGPGRTTAGWRLPDVSAVRTWLEHGSPPLRPTR